jgi:RHS repeat-associated protein
MNTMKTFNFSGIVRLSGFGSISNYVLLIFLLISATVVAEPPNYITGSATATAGMTLTYEFNNGNPVGDISWSITKGSVVSTWVDGNGYFASILWTQSGSGTITVNSYGEPLVGGSKTVTVSYGTPSTPNATITITQHCDGTATLARTSPSDAWYTWYWQTSSTGTSTSNSASSFLVSSSTHYYLRALANYGGNWSSSSQDAGTVTPQSATTGGSISGSGQYVCPGSNPSSFGNVTSASGGNGSITYAWEMSENQSSWSTISGSAPSLTTPPTVTSAGVNYFRRKATTNCGTAYSNTVTVTNYSVSAGSISGTQSVCETATPSSFTNASSASVNSGSFTYQWQSKVGSVWSDISGATASTFSPGVQTATTEFRRLAVGTCTSVATNTVTVTVLPSLTAGAAGSNQSLCYGSSATSLGTSNASGGDGSYSYQWQSSSNGSSWSDVNGEINATYSPGTMTATTHYRRRVISCNETNYTSTVTVTVNPLTTAGSIGSSQTICSGSAPASLTNGSSATGHGTVTYQWETSSNGSSWSNVGGATSSTYSPGSLYSATYYRRTATASCGNASTSAVTISIYSALSPGSINGTATICYNATPSTLGNSASASGNTGSYTYEWQKLESGGSWTAISSSNSVTHSPGALTITTQYRRKATTSCTSDYTPSATITVNPQLASGSIASSQTICTGTTPSSLTSTTNASGGDGVYNYQWETSSNGSSWSEVSGATSATYGPGSLSSLAYYRRRVTSCSDTKYSSAVTISMGAATTAGTIGSAQTICSGTVPASLTNTTSGTGEGTVTYQWEVSLNGSSYSNVSGATAANYSPGAATESLYYRRKATATCGAAHTSAIQIGIYSTLNPGSINGGAALCQGESGSALGNAASASGSTGSFTYQWQKRTPSSTWQNISGTNSTTYTPTSFSETMLYRRQVTTTCGSDNSNEVTIMINHRPGNPTKTFSSKVRGHGKAELTAMTEEPMSDLWVLKWYANSSGGSALATSEVWQPFITPDLSSPTSYWAELNSTESGCSSERVEVVANVLPLISPSYVIREILRVNTIKVDTLIDDLAANEKSITVSHFDGLMRVNQQIAVKASPGGKDIIQPVEYDSLGHTVKQYLGYSDTGTTGAFRSSYKADQSAFYLASNDNVVNDSVPYATAKFEPSPLGRMTMQKSVGKAFQADSHSLRQSYEFNGTDEVRRFTTSGTSTGFYPPKTLNKIIVTDENDNHTISYINGAGQLVLKKQHLNDTIDAAVVSYLETYYLYNDFGQNMYIISPKGVKELITNNWILSTDIKNNFTYQFVYDAKGRVIEKKVPGQAWMYFVYDPLNRPVLTQDGLLRENDQWMFVKYDRHGRPVFQGLYRNTADTTRAMMQTVADALYTSSNGTFGVNAWYETRGSALHGYTNNSFPKLNSDNSALEVHSVNYYDNHDFDNTGGDDYSYVTQGLQGENTPRINHRQLATGNRQLILGTSNWLKTYVFYDDYGRPIQVRSNNHLNIDSLNDLKTSVYLFDGTVTWTKNYHDAGSGRVTTVYDTMVYDTQGRLSKIVQKNNSSAWQTLVKYTYNELGQMVDKKLHNTSSENYLQSVDLRYTIRGQLEGINNSTLSTADTDAQADYFGMDLLYNNTDAGISNTGLYNGNISAVKWKGPASASGNADQRSYKYQYDKTNKLKDATFKMNSGSAWNKEANVHNEKIRYDQNGNIKTLARNHREHGLSGVTPVYTADEMDELSYTYQIGDRLKKVEDGSSDPNGFTNAVNVTEEYTYDINGNVTSDKNKGIDSIAYNFLGKPSVIYMNDTTRVEYTYDAAGSKLAMKTITSTDTVTTDYAGNFVYENGALSFFGSPEGRVVKKGNNLEYQYAIADHQGNTRVVFSSTTPTAAAPTATFEGDSNDDSGEYSNVVGSNVVTNTSANHTASGSKVVRMNQTYPVGPAKSLAVYPGDTVSMEVWAYYEGSSGWGSTSSGLSAFVTSLAGAFGGVSGGGGESGSIYGGVNDALGAVGMSGNLGSSRPSAYLNYILFDRNYNLMDMGWEAVPTSANMAKQKLTISDIAISEPGYIFVYLSYEAESNQYVYFDDFKVTHTKTNIVQYNEYYPFGMQTSTSWTREDSKNDHLYNAGSELNKRSGWYETFFRGYDAALGRFMQVDPLALLDHSTSPFVYAGNSPVFFNDPTGLQINVTGLSDSQVRTIYRTQNNGRYTSFDEWVDDNVDPGVGGGTWEITYESNTRKPRYTHGHKYEEKNVSIKFIPSPTPWMDRGGAAFDYRSPIERFDGLGQGIRGTRPPAQQGWSPLYKSDLEAYAKSIGYCTNCTSNQLGSLFESIFQQFASTQPSLVAGGFRKNTSKFPLSDRTTVPDFIADALPTQKGKPAGRIPGAVWFEAKAWSGGLYESSSTYQIRGHIDNLSSLTMPYRNYPNFAAALYLVTTADVTVSPGIYGHGTARGVDVHQVVGQYQIVGGSYIFNFGR